ncbi:MAG: hypothetical protein IKT40_01095 [Bacilli bacterium]|nr:hypothetical protein [Bacilli bacterium]
MFNNPYYGNTLQQLEQMAYNNTPYPQTIQKIQQIQPQVLTYFANSLQDMNKIQVNPNVVYIGINSTAKEIYTKQMSNDGIVDVNVYKIFEGKQEQNELHEILERLKTIENSMKEKKDAPVSKDVYAEPHAGEIRQSSINGFLQTNDGK